MTHWQPVHVLYGGAHLFRPDLMTRAGAVALKALDAHGYPELLVKGVEERVREKLRSAAVEDFRIDFEDGYGIRSDAEEDEHARAAGRTVAAGGVFPKRLGIRIRSLSGATRERGLRTLELFLQEATSLPDNFVVTLPKILHPAEVSTLVRALDTVPEIKIELMIETPQAMRNMGAFVDAAEGRCVGAHFGAYDYMSSCGITFAGQTLLHPVCDFARATMLMQLADRGIDIVDGVTNLIPAGDQAAVHAAWHGHGEAVRHALLSGIYQGWDIHPAQLVSRYATVFQFFAEFAEPAARRLRNFVEQQQQATRMGVQFDDEATVAGLRNFFIRAVRCGAIEPARIREMTGDHFAADGTDAAMPAGR